MTSPQMTKPVLQSLRDGDLSGSWVLDGSKSEVRLRSKSMWGLLKINGVFRQVSGSGVISGPEAVTGTITVTAASIDTKNKKRDEHLRSADFFEAAKYPDITFTVDRVSPAESGVSVSGSLSAHGITKPLAFDAAVSGSVEPELVLDAELTVNRADFGMSWNQGGMVSTDNTIVIHAVFTRS